MNILLGIISIIIVFTSAVLVHHFFKKEGLFVWISLSIIIANILVCKTIKIFGFATSIGNVMFASNFLATDILSENYEEKDAKKAVLMAFFFLIIFLVVIQLSLLYVPADVDVAQKAMRALFSLNLRVSIVSLILFFVCNNLDIYLFHKLAKKYPNKLWLRNNVSTIISNCLENYIFDFLAFYGIYSISTIFSIATTVSLIEIFIAICDTPFLYLAKKQS